MASRTIGIDLGTTNSCVATIDESGRPRIIQNKLGESTTPSMVAFTEPPLGTYRPLCGSPALRQAVTNPENSLFGVKRLIGRRYDDPEVQALARTLPYAVEAAPNGDAWVEVHGVQLSPPEVSALVLRELRAIAEEDLGGEVDGAIITVPSHFDNAQRRATLDAAEIAGLQVRRLLNEPTAAALGYGAHRGGDQRLAVCDLGGGTFDVSIVNVENGVLEVISAQGDLFLGGDDIDRAIIERLVDDVKVRFRVDLTEDPQALQRLKAEVVKAKHILSEARSATVELRYLATLAGGKALDYVRTIRRDELNAWIAPILRRLDAPCREAASRCGLSPSQVDAIILVGGMTRMPAIQNQIASIFGRPPLKVVNPDEIVSVGAATQCAILDGAVDGVVLLDVTSRALGLCTSDGKSQQLIPRNATIPTREQRIVATSEDDQSVLCFDVFEGEAARAEDNRHLGRFECRDLPKAPAGEVLVLVEFTVDVDGILRVSTCELASGERPQLRMVAAAGLTRADRQRIRAGLALRR